MLNVRCKGSEPERRADGGETGTVCYVEAMGAGRYRTGGVPDRFGRDNGGLCDKTAAVTESFWQGKAGRTLRDDRMKWKRPGKTPADSGSLACGTLACESALFPSAGRLASAGVLSFPGFPLPGPPFLLQVVSAGERIFMSAEKGKIRLSGPCRRAAICRSIA